MIQSDIEFDETKCKHCGRLLHRHFGGKRTRELLREYDGDVVDAVVADVTCANCGHVNEISWWAQLPTTPHMRNLMAMERRRQMRVIDGRRSSQPAQICGD